MVVGIGYYLGIYGEGLYGAGYIFSQSHQLVLFLSISKLYPTCAVMLVS